MRVLLLDAEGDVVGDASAPLAKSVTMDGNGIWADGQCLFSFDGLSWFVGESSNVVPSFAGWLVMPTSPVISHHEAQELHECIGAALEAVKNGETAVVAELERARELAAIFVSDTMGVDPAGTPHPDYDPSRPRFKIYVTGHEPDEEPGWRYKLTLVDRMYQDSDGLPVDAIAAGDSWLEAFARVGEWVERAIATDHCIFI